MKQLYQIVANVLEVPVESVTEETGPLTEPKWDSFHHVNLMMVVEDTYKVSFSNDEIVSVLSVGDIARALKEKGIEVV